MKKALTLQKAQKTLQTVLVMAVLLAPCISFSANGSGLSDIQAELQKKMEAAARKQREIEAGIKQEMNIDFTAIYDKLVIVNGKSDLGGKSSGSGFIAQMDGKTYLFTSKRIMFGADVITFKTAEGRKLKPRSVELSGNSNIARLQLVDETGFEISDSLTEGLSVGVFGNSEGGGVATETFGRVGAFGSQAFDVSAPFGNGYSGSPVLNADQQVIGMASHINYIASKDKGGMPILEAHRICHRLRNKEWQAVNWKKYNQKYGQVYMKEKQILDPVVSMIQQWMTNPYGAIYAKDIDDPLIAEFLRSQQGLIDSLARDRKQTTVTVERLEGMNRGIQNGVRRSAGKLITVCEKYKKRTKFLKSHRDPTGFLQSEFQNYVDYLDLSSRSIAEISKVCGTTKIYGFKK